VHRGNQRRFNRKVFIRITIIQQQIHKNSRKSLPAFRRHSRIGNFPMKIEAFPLWTNSIKSVLIHHKTLLRQIEMVKMKDTVPNDTRFDLTHLIRSVQRIEGNPDCFGKTNGRCDQADCCWKSYCRQPPGVSTKQSHSMDKQGGETWQKQR
jgi:hypothetical protein